MPGSKEGDVVLDMEGGATGGQSDTEVRDELMALKKNYTELLAKFQDVGLPPRPSVRSSAQTVERNQEVYVRREFKITGQIGKPGDKDKLTFGSLAHQIEAGVAKKYTEREIVAAVIRAVTAGTTLQSFLEGKTDLTLMTLRKFLRYHFKEKDATALYKDLINLTQSASETPEDYLMRALDLRQKVVFVACFAVDSCLWFLSNVSNANRLLVVVEAYRVNDNLE